MALPKDETAIVQHNYVNMQKRDHIDVLASRAYDQGDLVVEGSGFQRFCGIADMDIPINTLGTIHIEEGIEVSTTRAHAGEVFTVPGEPVYYDTATLEYYQTVPGGMNYPCVGLITVPPDANGCFYYEKFRYAVVEPTT